MSSTSEQKFIGRAEKNYLNQIRVMCGFTNPMHSGRNFWVPVNAAAGVKKADEITLENFELAKAKALEILAKRTGPMK